MNAHRIIPFLAIVLLTIHVSAQDVVIHDPNKLHDYLSSLEPRAGGIPFEELPEEIRVEIAKVHRSDIDKDIPLSVAIDRANAKFGGGNPLTEDEVLAAIRAIKLKDPDISEAVFEIFQRVVNERVLPKGMYFSNIREWRGQDMTFQVDWRDLSFTSLSDEGNTYTYRIREQFVSSRPVVATTGETRE